MSSAIAALQSILTVSKEFQKTCIGDPRHAAAIVFPPNFDMSLLQLPVPQNIRPTLLSTGITPAMADQLTDAYMRAAQELHRSHEERLRNLALQLPEDFHSANGLRLLQRRTDVVKKLYLDRLDQWQQHMTDTAKSRVQPARREPQGHQKTRHRFNHYYVPLLEHYFAENPLPTHADKTFLANKCGMTFRQIHVWFQNRRKRTRKEGQVYKRKPQHELAKLPLDTLIAKMPHSIIPEDQRVPYVDSDASEYESYYESSDDDASGRQEKYPRDPNAIDIFNIPAPSYAYPAVYPPEVDIEPFPEGWKPSFPPPQWERRPPKATTKRAPGMDFDEFAQLFDQMKASSKKRRRRKLPQDARKPTEETPKPPKPDRSAATIAITTKPLPAPLPALIRPMVAPRRFLVPKPSVAPALTSRKRPYASIETESSSSTAAAPASQSDVANQPSLATQGPIVPASSRKRPRVSADTESHSTAAAYRSQADVAKHPPPTVSAPTSRKRSRASSDAESTSATAVPPPQSKAAKQQQPSALAKKSSSRKTPSQRTVASLPKRVPKNPSIAHRKTTSAPPLATVPPLDHSPSPSPPSRTASPRSTSSKRIRLSSDSSTTSEAETPEPCPLPLPPNVQPPVLSTAGFDFISPEMNDLFNDPLVHHPSQVEGFQLDFSSSAPYYGGEQTTKLAFDFDFEHVLASHFMHYQP